MTKPHIPVPIIVLRAMRGVCDYCREDEARDFEEHQRTALHIFRFIRIVEELLAEHFGHGGVDGKKLKD